MQTERPAVSWYSVKGSSKTAGTHLLGYVTASYKRLVELFGKPIGVTGDGYKVSTEWIFVASNGMIATLYDWKSTNLYDPALVSPEVFRSFPSYEWHVGAHDQESADAFISWLRGVL